MEDNLFFKEIGKSPIFSKWKTIIISRVVEGNLNIKVGDLTDQMLRQIEDKLNFKVYSSKCKKTSIFSPSFS